MGLRFRRSIQLIPGVRLNFSGSGVSATVGPRGARLTVGGVRGPAINLGIPGTGLYMRQSLTASSRTGGAPTKAQRDKWERQEARAQARAQSEAEVHEHEQELEELATILGRRDRDPLDWVTVFAKSPPPAPTPYAADTKAPRLAEVEAELRAAKPAWRWWLAIATAGVAAWLAPQPAGRLSLLVFAAGLAAHLVTARRQIPATAAQLFHVRYSAFKQADQEARAAHYLDQQHQQEEYRQSEDGKRHFRELEAEENLALAAALLEVELSNEDLGVPVTFEIGFEDLHTARLLIALPEYQVIPAERERLTKTGKVSRRPMAQRDRRNLYATVCAGVALRLVYETYRVLPFVHRVQVIGTASRLGFADSHHRYAGLALETTRDSFHGINLDLGEPADILRRLGGQFDLSRDGVPTPIEGVDDTLG